MSKKIQSTAICLIINLLLTAHLHAKETPKQKENPTAYQLTWSLNGQKCLAKVGIDRYEVLDDSGQLVWSRVMQANNVLISPDGSQLAFVLPADGLHIITLQTQQDRKLFNLQGTQNMITHLAWSPNGDKLAYYVFSNDQESDSPGQLMFKNVDGSN